MTLVPGAVGVVEVLAGVDGGADDALLRHVAPAVVDLEPDFFSTKGYSSKIENRHASRSKPGLEALPDHRVVRPKVDSHGPAGGHRGGEGVAAECACVKKIVMIRLNVVNVAVHYFAVTFPSSALNFCNFYPVVTAGHALKHKKVNV